MIDEPIDNPNHETEDRGELSFEAIAEIACTRLGQNKSVRRNLPGNGRLKIDRQLPFLCVYRSPVDQSDPGTRKLVTTEAAYLFSSGEREFQNGLVAMCKKIGSTMSDHFGTFVFFQIWAQEEPPTQQFPRKTGTPAFEIVSPEKDALPGTIETFEKALSEIAIQGVSAEVSIRSDARIAASDPEPLFDLQSADLPAGCVIIGLAVRPIYREANGETVYPIVLESLRQQLSRAFRKTIASFTGAPLDEKVHFESYGPSSLVKAARIVDQELCEVAELYDFLLQVTPTNSEEAWISFRDSDFQEVPEFRYRPLPYHPVMLKRRLFGIEIERIEDPTVAHLFWEKQEEVDWQLSALRDLRTSEFFHSSLHLYGVPDKALVDLARSILEDTPQENCGGENRGTVSVKEFVASARTEIDYYHQKLPSFTATVDICNDIAARIMVSHDRLLVSENLKVRKERVEPLLHHEVGTHLLTYFNGRSQPFRQLYAGLAGCDELQEGLAVLAEYICGGLTTSRLRKLAGRVVAVDSLVASRSFRETFTDLHERYGFSASQAFTMTLRVYRGGGLTKDAIYLRGLRELLKYLGQGHDIQPLYVGKIGLHHVPYVQEMRRRGVINAPSLLPRFWEDDENRERLEACRGMSVMDLTRSAP